MPDHLANFEAYASVLISPHSLRPPSPRLAATHLKSVAYSPDLHSSVSRASTMLLGSVLSGVYLVILPGVESHTGVFFFRFLCINSRGIPRDYLQGATTNTTATTVANPDCHVTTNLRHQRWPSQTDDRPHHNAIPSRYRAQYPGSLEGARQRHDNGRSPPPI